MDERLVRELLAEQHPDLVHLPLRTVASGWDNVVFRLGDALAVRVPRRELAAHLVRHEQLALPQLAPRLPVPVPVPVRVGVPSARFRWHWSVVPWFEGRLLAEAGTPVGTAVEAAVAADLARFVRALHVPAPSEAPANPVRGVPLADRDAAMRERLSGGAISRAADIGAVWDAALRAPAWNGPPLWLHGDLHPANLLVRDGRLAAVLDFGDVTAGDPATDLATAWFTFDTAGRRAFRSAVDHDDATWLRARGWATCIGAALVTTEPDSVVHGIGVAALERVLQPD